MWNWGYNNYKWSYFTLLLTGFPGAHFVLFPLEAEKSDPTSHDQMFKTGFTHIFSRYLKWRYERCIGICAIFFFWIPVVLSTVFVGTWSSRSSPAIQLSCDFFWATRSFQCDISKKNVVVHILPSTGLWNESWWACIFAAWMPIFPTKWRAKGRNKVRVVRTNQSRWWVHVFLIFTPLIGEMIQFDLRISYLSNLPTSLCIGGGSHFANSESRWSVR